MEGDREESGGSGTAEESQPPLAEDDSGGGGEVAEALQTADDDASAATAPPTAEDHAEEEEEEEEEQQQQQRQQHRVEAVTEKDYDGGGAEEEALAEADDGGYDRFGHLELEADVEEEEEEEERPKLAEGFYVIEAVRKKRVRKGKVQYLIKWRSWPETENTWEPLENLQSCSDVIDAFEESLRSTKLGTRRRKRRNGCGGRLSQPKKKQLQRSPAAATYNVPAVRVRIMDEPLPLNLANEGGNASWSHLMVSPEHEERKGENGLDLKLKELEGMMPANEGNGETCAPANGVLKVESVGTVQDDCYTGAKRRKRGSVKRFKQESASFGPSGMENSMARANNGPCARVGRRRIQNPKYAQNDFGLNKNFDNSINISAITEIIRPIRYSTSVSNDTQDIVVTFMAMRSDGKKVMVDNKFLKANNPLLLIDFYEQHLRYSPT